MLKKTITYKNLDNEDVTDDFYFALNKPEIIKLEMSTKGGLDGLVKQIIEAEDGARILELLDEIVGMSIGKRSPDGKQFVKNQAIRDEFFQSNAYEMFFMEILSDAEESGSAFIRGIMPASMQDDINKPVENVRSVSDIGQTPAYIRENRAPTPDEIRKMSPTELQEAFARRNATP